MKTIFKKTILVVTLASIVLLGCKKKDEEPEPEPTPTPTPTYNFTAKVDGVDYKSTGKVQIMYDYLVISAGNDNDKLWFIFNLLYDSVQVKVYPCNSSANGGVYSMAQYSNGNTQTGYSTDATSVATDKLTITKYDTTAKKISGTFNFTGYDDDGTGAKKVITDGIFTDLTW